MFFSSPVNTIDSHVALLDKLGCRIFLMPSPRPQMGLEILERRSMQVLHVPDTEFLLGEEAVDIYRFLKDFEQAKHDPFVVFHSSGTTGTPKPLIYKHGSDATVDAYQLLPMLGDHPQAWTGLEFRGKRVFSCQPFFHACGIPFLLNAAIYHDFVGVIMPQIMRYDVDIVSAVHEHANIQISFLNPGMIVQITQNDRLLESLRKIETVSFAGGSLPKQAGDIVSRYVALKPIFGSTECSSLPVCPPPSPSEWEFYRFSPFLNGEFRHFDQDYYELVIVRSQALSIFQAVFYTLDEDAKEFHTRDLFQAHPTRAGMWKHCGRRDDVLVFTDGRKLNPVQMEAAIESHPLVDAAIICGHGRNRPSLLVQPISHDLIATAEKRSHYIDQIWPMVEEAVRNAPRSGSLSKDMTMLAQADKPMIRAGLKITVQRIKTNSLYEKEINELYETTKPSVTEFKANAVLTLSPSEMVANSQQGQVNAFPWSEKPHYVYGFQAREVDLAFS